MHNLKRLLPLGFFAMLLLAGCQGGDDGVNTPAPTNETGAGLVRGDISADAASFEFTSSADFGGPTPPPGPLFIRGHDARYDAELGALVVDLTLVNGSSRSYPEPVNLTFVQMLPAGVTLLNADNEQTGPGASFNFEFENDDAMWTPGEESLPRTAQFLIATGVSLGFTARIDVGQDPLGGAIGGLIWHDANEDGAVDVDETGIEGVGVRIDGEGEQNWLAMTAPDGMYRVDGLPAGFYTVTALPRPDLRPTTPPQMQVLLVDAESGVSDFLVADFGCRVTAPDSLFQVGDCLQVKGEFAMEPDRLVAAHADFCDRRGYDCDGEDEDGDDDGEDEDKCDGIAPSRIAGPVTAIDAEGGMVAVMGTWLHVAVKSGDRDDDDDGDDHNGDLELGDLAVGDRVRADVVIVDDGDGHHLEAARLRRFHGHFDRISGQVQDVAPLDEGTGIVVHILDTAVILQRGVMGCDD